MKRVRRDPMPPPRPPCPAAESLVDASMMALSLNNNNDRVGAQTQLHSAQTKSPEASGNKNLLW